MQGPPRAPGGRSAKRTRTALSAALLLLAGCAARAGAAAPSSSCTPQPGAMPQRYTLSAPVAALTLGAAPLTLGPCRLSADAVRSVMAAASPGAAVLLVEGVRAPRGATVLVFVDRPGASAATPTADAAFAGSFTLLRGGPGGGVNVQVALAPQLAAAVRDDGEFTLTFVAVDPRGRAEDPGLSMDRVVLELH
jgi:hypothetical protein